MDIKTLFLAASVAIFFDLWPSLAKPLGIKSGIVSFMVVIVSAIVVAIVTRKDIVAIRTVSPGAIAIVLAVSVLNGLAIYFYAATNARPEVDSGTFMVLVFLLQVAFAPLLDRVLNGAKMNTYQYVGLALSVPVMILLTHRQR